MRVEEGRVGSVGRSRGLYVVPDRNIPRAEHVNVGRALHLVDLENLLRGEAASWSRVARVAESYEKVAPIQRGDHIVVAANGELVFYAHDYWPGARILFGQGPNGSDLALMGAVADAEWVASRFDRLVIGSGDGIFANAASHFRDLGIAVGVVAPHHALSYRLRRQASYVCVLPAFSARLTAAG